MDSVKHMSELELIGKAIAKKVKLEHFSNFLESPLTVEGAFWATLGAYVS